MGIVDKVEDKVVEWLFGKAIKKAIIKGVTLLVAWLMGLGLSKYGIDLNPEGLTAAIYMVLEVVRNWVKIKYPKIGALL
jgi:hypothetical protein